MPSFRFAAARDHAAENGLWHSGPSTYNNLEQGAVDMDGGTNRQHPSYLQGSRAPSVRPGELFFGTMIWSVGTYRHPGW